MVASLRIAVLLPFLVSSAFSCSGGYGDDAQFVSNPTFVFDFNPPVQWTFFTGAVLPTGMQANTGTPYIGQRASATDAQQQIQNDLDAAVLKALNTLRVSAFGVRYTLAGYAPADILIRGSDLPTGQTLAAWQVLGSYVPQFGAVVAQRTTAGVDSGTPYKFTARVQVSNAPMATRYQWKVIAGEVFKNLMTNARVNFLTGITIQ